MDHLVDFSTGDIVKVHSRQLETFQDIAKGNREKQRYRLCLQDSPDNKLQDMILCRTRGDYTPPDKHYDCPESHTILQGTEAIVLFSDEGAIIDAFLLDREKGYLSYRINASLYHMTIPITDVAIDYEVKLGPFSSTSNIYPDWAPDGSNKDEATIFLNKIENEIKRFLEREE